MVNEVASEATRKSVDAAYLRDAPDKLCMLLLILAGSCSDCVKLFRLWTNDNLLLISKSIIPLMPQLLQN